METYHISHERFQAWLQAQKEKGITVTTGTYNFMKDWLERRVYAGTPPDDVEERRRSQKELHDSLSRLDAKIDNVVQNTEDVKNSFSDLWSGIGQMFASRKARRK